MARPSPPEPNSTRIAIATSAHDPFAVFGLEPTPELDLADLEKRFIQLSRETHPDMVQAVDSEENVDRLLLAAQLNDAFKALKSPWSRARAALELKDPGVLERTAKLPPTLLMEVMEQQEEAIGAEPDQHPALKERTEQALKGVWNALVTHFDQGDFPAAALQVHLSRYHQRTLDAVTPGVADH